MGDKKDEACKEDTKAAVDDDEESAAVGVSTWEYVKIIFALIFVIALLYGVLRFLNSRNTKYQHSKMMQNLGGISLGAQKSVQIVKIGHSLYLVGVGDNVNMLKEITDDNEKKHSLRYTTRSKFNQFKAHRF
ncbi:flagellar biosynthetic protein FliO [Kurthia massiliensis]|uniref:flagellar biosynthetic protein FliO n=1 Tax=Kurthia massiliensis TaxID=1033739 RepID=UPI000289D450|nr:flagellar biosynthetic protein FliO [Kurthia massiliensis]